MSDIFISYSRKNGQFVQRLNTALVTDNRVVWVDWQAIPAGEDWWKEIQSGIENTETFVAIISENWLKSPICHEELEYARANNKRVLPLIYQSIDSDVEQSIKGDWMDKSYEQIARSNWEYIQQLNWIFVDSDNKFEDGFARLLAAVDEDMPHLKAHTRYQRRALEWKRSNENPSFLLVGDDLTFAEEWLTTADTESKTPHPTEIQRRYIENSRQLEDAELQREQAQTKRIQQFRLASIILGIIGVVAIIATTIAIPISLNAQNNNATSIAQVATAENILVTSTTVAKQFVTVDARLSEAQQQIQSVRETLTPIPATLTTVAEDLNQAIDTQNEAFAQVTDISEQVEIAGATLTPVAPTLTAVARQVLQTEQNLYISNVSSVAMLNVRNGNFGEAVNRMTELVNLFPNNVAVYTERAFIYREIGELDKAYDDITTAIELAPMNAGLYNSRAITLEYMEGRSDEALADYSIAIELEPNDANYYINRGIHYRDLGDYETALADFNRAIELNPNDGRAYDSRGFLHQQLGMIDEAFDDYSVSIELSPFTASAYGSRASIYSDRGDLELALADLNRAIGLDPEQPSYYYSRAFVHRDRGDIEQGIADLNISIELDATDSFQNMSRGLLYYDSGQYDLAIDDFTTFLEVNANDPDILVLRAYAYVATGNYDMAIADFSQYLEAFPDDINVRITRAESFIDIGEYASAVADYDIILSEDTNADTLPVDSLINQGWAYYKLEDYDNALANYNFVLGAIPDDVFALGNRGLAYLAKGEIKSAFADFQRMATLEVENETDESNNAIAIFISDLDTEIDRNSTNSNLYMMRGYLHYMNGDTISGQDDLIKAEQLGMTLIPEIDALR